MMVICTLPVGRELVLAGLRLRMWLAVSCYWNNEFLVMRIDLSIDDLLFSVFSFQFRFVCPFAFAVAFPFLSILFCVLPLRQVEWHVVYTRVYH